jgi:hypothetical protein
MGIRKHWMKVVSPLRVLPGYAAIAMSACLCMAPCALAQQSTSSGPKSDLPSAPDVMPGSTTSRVQSPHPESAEPLTLGERLRLEVHTSLGVSAFLVPAGDAAFDMADPPSHYPREWKDGGAAFGRNYGAEFARHTTGGFTHFAVAAIDREDPRYYPSTSTNFAKRTVHALIFTLFDRSDSGHTTLAVSNLAGSAAAGAVGMAFYPDGFRDITHAYQRAAVETTTFASHNLVAEFSPEIVLILHKLHVSDRIANTFLPQTSLPRGSSSQVRDQPTSSSSN